MSFLSFGITGLIIGFNDIFPLMGIFFYAGYAIAYLLKATFLFPKNMAKNARWFYCIIFMLYSTGAILYLLLFPAPSYTYLPSLVAIVPSVIIVLIISRKWTVYKVYNWKLTFPNYASIFLILLLFVPTFLYTKYRDKKEIVQITQADLVQLASLEQEANTDPSIEKLLKVARLFFSFENYPESEIWFNKVIAIDHKMPVALAYLAALKGIKADQSKSVTVKIKLLNEAMQEMDHVVATNRDNHEVLYIRAEFYSEVPAIFKTKNIAIQDCLYIITQMPYQEEYFILASKLLNKIGKKEIRKLNPDLQEKVKLAIKSK